MALVVILAMTECIFTVMRDEKRKHPECFDQAKVSLLSTIFSLTITVLSLGH